MEHTERETYIHQVRAWINLQLFKWSAIDLIQEIYSLSYSGAIADNRTLSINVCPLYNVITTAASNASRPLATLANVFFCHKLVSFVLFRLLSLITFEYSVHCILLMSPHSWFAGLKMVHNEMDTYTATAGDVVAFVSQFLCMHGEFFFFSDSWRSFLEDLLELRDNETPVDTQETNRSAPSVLIIDANCLTKHIW